MAQSRAQTGRGGGPTLVWGGRTFLPGAEADAPAITPDEQVEGLDPGVRIARGDALDVARSLGAEGLEGKIDLVYLDPPFASNADYAIEARLDGPADGRVRRSIAYGDKQSIEGYLEMLAPRLDAMTRLLSPRATIWVHLDWRASYLVRVLLDEILGRDAFVNEIVWRRAPNLGRQAASGQFGRTLDTIVVYGKRPGAKIIPPTRLEPIEPSAIRWDDQKRPFTTAPRGDYTDISIAKLDKEGRVHRTPSGKVYIKYFLVKNGEGAWCRERRVDALWTDVPPLRHAATSERTGFPTQKPRALLDRIIACATKPGDTVVDLFSGSGTTGESAHALGRRAILGDAGAAAIATSRARLARAGARVSLERCGVTPPEGDSPRVRVERVDDSRVRVSLVSPTEPLAWAIDTNHVQNTFKCAWRSERIPGARSTAAATEAIVDLRGALAVRVYSDDGAVATHRVPTSDIDARPRPGRTA